MEKILPINFNNLYDIECWSFFRFSIITAYPNLKEWHLKEYNNIFVDKENNVLFGRDGERFNQFKVYNEVLKSECLFYDDLSRNNISEFIIKNINSKKYTILEVDCAKLLGQHEESKIHEIMVYGYNLEKKVFYIPYLENKQWYEKEINFDNLEQAYIALNSLNDNSLEILMTKRWFHYPITSLSIKEEFNYNPKNEIFELYKDLDFILYEYQNYRKDKDDKLEVIYSGYLSCYKGLEIAANKILSGEDFYQLKESFSTYSYPLNLKKLLSFRKKLEERFSILLPIKYDTNIIEELSICINMALKYEMTGNMQIIIDIKSKLFELYISEKKLLNIIQDDLKKFLKNKYII